jgi:hypothetical protein
MFQTPKDKTRGLLVSIEKRMKPSMPPWRNDEEVFNYWVELAIRYTEEEIGAAFANHLAAGETRWPNYYKFRDLLRAERRRNRGTRPLAPVDDCEICDNTGWQQADNYTDPKTGNEYTQVRPCSCFRGFNTEKTRIWQDQIEKNQTTTASTSSSQTSKTPAPAPTSSASTADPQNASTNSSSLPF